MSRPMELETQLICWACEFRLLSLLGLRGSFDGLLGLWLGLLGLHGFLEDLLGL